jgi:hypothetical protein
VSKAPRAASGKRDAKTLTHGNTPMALGKVLGVVSRSDFTAIEIDRLDEEEHLKEVLW